MECCIDNIINDTTALSLIQETATGDETALQNLQEDVWVKMSRW